MNTLLLSALITPDVGLAFWTVFIFIILLILLRKVAWKPIVTGLKNREHSINEALESAKKAREEMSQLQSQNEELLQEARQERDAMLREARDIKEKIVAESKTAAQEEGRKIIAKAREEIEREKEKAFREVKDQVAMIAVDAAEKILRQHLSNPEQQQQLIRDYIKETKLN
ncbi:MAG: F0F1 ATP synthase subunit B [Bacteroidia bacterium]